MERTEKTPDYGDHPYQGTVITSHPFGDEIDEIIPQTFGLKPAAEPVQKGEEKGDEKSAEKSGNDAASASGTERYLSPAPSYGLPRFEGPEDPNRPPSPEPVIPQDELDEDERLRAKLDDRAEAVRKFLRLDEDDDEVMAAWDELERWKGLKCKLHLILFIVYSNCNSSDKLRYGIGVGHDDQCGQ